MPDTLEKQDFQGTLTSEAMRLVVGDRERFRACSTSTEPAEQSADMLMAEIQRTMERYHLGLISNRTLKMMDEAMGRFETGEVAGPINLPEDFGFEEDAD